MPSPPHSSARRGSCSRRVLAACLLVLPASLSAGPVCLRLRSAAACHGRRLLCTLRPHLRPSPALAKPPKWLPLDLLKITGLPTDELLRRSAAVRRRHGRSAPAIMDSTSPDASRRAEHLPR